MSQEYKVDLFDNSNGEWIRDIVLSFLPRINDLISFSGSDLSSISMEFKVTEIGIYINESHIEYHISGVLNCES